MTTLRIDQRNREHAAKLRATIDEIQKALTIARADVANTREREQTLRDAENASRDANRIAGRKS
jgi:hypothetical protein